MYKMATC